MTTAARNSKFSDHPYNSNSNDTAQQQKFYTRGKNEQRTSNFSSYEGYNNNNNSSAATGSNKYNNSFYRNKPYSQNYSRTSEKDEINPHSSNDKYDNSSNTNNNGNNLSRENFKFKTNKDDGAQGTDFMDVEPKSQNMENDVDKSGGSTYHNVLFNQFFNKVSKQINISKGDLQGIENLNLDKLVSNIVDITSSQIASNTGNINIKINLTQNVSTVNTGGVGSNNLTGGRAVMSPNTGMGPRQQNLENQTQKQLPVTSSQEEIQPSNLPNFPKIEKLKEYTITPNLLTYLVGQRKYYPMLRNIPNEENDKLKKQFSQFFTDEARSNSAEINRIASNKLTFNLCPILYVGTDKINPEEKAQDQKLRNFNCAHAIDMKQLEKD